MTSLGQVVLAIEKYRRFVLDETRKARTNEEFGQQILQRWQEAKAGIGTTLTPTGLRLPRLALPDLDEAGEIARFLCEEGLPGEFPFVTAAYPEQYLEPAPTSSTDNENRRNGDKTVVEEPTRLFAGLGLAEDTNARFHYLSRNQRSKRLSTAFDGPTLYGVGAGAGGVFGKIGEGGVAIDTVEDMERLYAGFALDQPNVSVSMTISGPAPILLAMFLAAAKHRFGPDVGAKLRGTIQADVLKEVQAQNELIFPIEPSLRVPAWHLATRIVDHVRQKPERWFDRENQLVLSLDLL
jgi:methylmalonyl-CoA mutase N-terminal domain/subunit